MSSTCAPRVEPVPGGTTQTTDVSLNHVLVEQKVLPSLSMQTHTCQIITSRILELVGDCLYTRTNSRHTRVFRHINRPDIDAMLGGAKMSADYSHDALADSRAVRKIDGRLHGAGSIQQSSERFCLL